MPSQAPSVALSLWPSVSVPLIFGATVLVGLGGSGDSGPGSRPGGEVLGLPRGGVSATMSCGANGLPAIGTGAGGVTVLALW